MLAGSGGARRSCGYTGDSIWGSALGRGREAERGREARPVPPARPRPGPVQAQDVGDQRRGRLRGFPADQQQRDRGPGRQHQPPPPLESVTPPRAGTGGAGPPVCPPPPAPAPLISSPAALCVLGAGGDEPPAAALDSGGTRSAWGASRRWGGGGGLLGKAPRRRKRRRRTLASIPGDRPGDARQPGTCLALRFCVCLLHGAGGRGPGPLPGPRDPRDNPPAVSPPGPGLPLTRSLHRQHPDSSVRLFVCFKYIYIYYIYINILIYLGGCGARGCHHRAASPSAPKMRG